MGGGSETQGSTIGARRNRAGFLRASRHLYMATPLPPATYLDHTPRGHAGRYVQACYTGMRDDVDRTEAYRRAIVEAAPGKVVMDLGTGAGK